MFIGEMQCTDCTRNSSYVVLYAYMYSTVTHQLSKAPLLLVRGVQLEFHALQRLLELRGVLLEPATGLFRERQFILQLLCTSEYVHCSYEGVCNLQHECLHKL